VRAKYGWAEHNSECPLECQNVTETAEPYHMTTMSYKLMKHAVINSPFVSVLVPVYNGKEYIAQCLDALCASSYRSFEIIVIDDCSTDETASIAQQKGVTVLQTPKQSGPGVARNTGAQYAKGDILLFIDADITVREKTISMVVDNFLSEPDIAALFGSYDNEPAESNFISQYKNLLHYYHHQHANREAFSFWAGCGAIRKDVFLEMGGFDAMRYKIPSIEDIELGYRLRSKGYRIILDKDIQVKHLKRWDLPSLIRTDILQRAIPWSRLILESKIMPNDLNLKISQKISSVSVFLMIFIIPLLFAGQITLFDLPLTTIVVFALMTLFANFLLLNRELYNFYMRNRGFLFAVEVIPLHILYYVYSGASFSYCWILHRFSGHDNL
jgi:glycosyltransferase involved in cell wall biosynthesis